MALNVNIDPIAGYKDKETRGFTVIVSITIVSLILLSLWIGPEGYRKKSEAIKSGDAPAITAKKDSVKKIDSSVRKENNQTLVDKSKNVNIKDNHGRINIRL